MAKKVHRIIEKTVRKWCLENGVIFDGYFHAKRQKHDWVELRVLGEKLKVPVACTPGKGPESASRTTLKSVKRSVRLKIEDIKSRPRYPYLKKE